MDKICLINPPTTQGDDLYFPMALVTLGTHLKETGHPLEIIDFDFDRRKDPALSQWSYFKKRAIQRLEGTNARIFGISSICSNFPVSLLLAQEIRRRFPSSRIILGGPQPSSVPEEILNVCPWVDVIVIGEGEKTLPDLIA